MRRDPAKLHRAAWLVLSLLLALPLAARAEDVAPLSAAAIAKFDADPELRRARKTMRDPKRDAEVLALFSKAAARGNPIAQSYLGWLYYMGHGLAQNDRIAAAWYRRAAVQGFADAELRLGLMYWNGRDLGGIGISLARDPGQAIAWLQRAADHGSVAALGPLADAYLASVKIDRAIAVYERAAEQGSSHALGQLCSLYATTKNDPAARDEWCGLAAQFAGDTPEPPALAILSSDRMPMAAP